MLVEVPTKRGSNHSGPRPTRIKKVVLRILYKQLMTTIEREVLKLMIKTDTEKLDPSESKQLIEYIKLVSEMKALEELEELEKKK